MNSSAKKTRRTPPMVGSVKIKSYLKQFIIHNERLDATSPIIDLSKDGFTANLIKLFITGKTIEERNRSKGREEYNDRLMFAVNEHQVAQGRMFLSPEGTEALNKLIQKYFHELILSRVILGVSVGADAKSVILDFLHEHGIEPDENITLDAIVKANYRLRKSKKIPLFRKPDSPVGATASFTTIKPEIKERVQSAGF